MKANKGNECPLCSGDPDEMPRFLVKMGKLEGMIRQLERKWERKHAEDVLRGRKGTK